MRPLEYLKNKGLIDYSVAYQNNSKGICLSDIKPLIQKNTYMIICNHISNVNGSKADIKEIGKFCKQNHLIFLVDGAQSCGHEQIDIKDLNIDDKEFDKVEAIICSMTKQEKRNTKLLNGSRRLRIAKGSGTTVQDVNKFMKSFEMTQKMMKQMKSNKGGMRKMMKNLENMDPKDLKNFKI